MLSVCQPFKTTSLLSLTPATFTGCVSPPHLLQCKVIQPRSNEAGLGQSPCLCTKEDGGGSCFLLV